MDGPVWCVVVAGGGGQRFGGLKQFEHLAGQRVVDRSVATSARVADGVVLVVPEQQLDLERLCSAATAVCAGGPTRSGSVRAGLAVVPDDAAVIVVHDAARPLASEALFRRVIGAVQAGAEGAIPGVAVGDTIKEIGGPAVDPTAVGTVGRTLDRERLLAVQTPQAFAADALRAAHAGGGEATDDAALVEAAGGTVVFVPGEVHNIKITHPRDLAVAAVHLDAQGHPR